MRWKSELVGSNSNQIYFPCFSVFLHAMFNVIKLIFSLQLITIGKQQQTSNKNQKKINLHIPFHLNLVVKPAEEKCKAPRVVLKLTIQLLCFDSCRFQCPSSPFMYHYLSYVKFFFCAFRDFKITCFLLCFRKKIQSLLIGGSNGNYITWKILRCFFWDCTLMILRAFYEFLTIIMN